MPDATARTSPGALFTTPIDPMLARVAEALPEGDGFLFEPKWDGFRAIVFRTATETRLQSRDGRPLNRYFPELEAALAERLPKGTILDGEIVVARAGRLDFDALQQRVHPAPSRVRRLAIETPASFVAFDLLAAGGRATFALPQHERRVRLERLLGSATPPLHLTPMTRDRDEALRWLANFEGAGLDGVMAKAADAAYQPGKRAMWKIKHVGTADCVVAGFRWYRGGRGGRGGKGSAAVDDSSRSDGQGRLREDAVGSLLLGLFDDAGVLQQVGATSSFTMAMRRALVDDIAPLRIDALDEHPWRSAAEPASEAARRLPGTPSRWSTGTETSWEPLRIERVAEVRYDHLEGDRFRHATTFLRWRLDKPPQDCRYDQLEVVPAFALAEVFRAAGGRAG